MRLQFEYRKVDPGLKCRPHVFIHTQTPTLHTVPPTISSVVNGKARSLIECELANAPAQLIPPHCPQSDTPVAVGVGPVVVVGVVGVGVVAMVVVVVVGSATARLAPPRTSERPVTIDKCISARPEDLNHRSRDL